MMSAQTLSAPIPRALDLSRCCYEFREKRGTRFQCVKQFGNFRDRQSRAFNVYFRTRDWLLSLVCDVPEGLTSAHSRRIALHRKAAVGR
jgi:hypothetical protein